MPYFDWTIDLLGVEIDVRAEYRITNYGTPYTWDDPGDAPEIVIEEVYSLLSGLDLFSVCENTHFTPYNIVAWTGPYTTNPMTRAVCGYAKHTLYCTPLLPNMIHSGTVLKITSPTILDGIEQAILENEDFTPDSDPTDYY